jgi:nucleolar pre-ribosomal-associated protein 1
LKTLALRVYETCDQDRVEEWSSGAMAQTIAALA